MLLVSPGEDRTLKVAREAWKKDEFNCKKAVSIYQLQDNFNAIERALKSPNGAPKVESHQMQEDIKVRVHRTGPNGESVVSYE